jgi:hypothetical protein
VLQKALTRFSEAIFKKTTRHYLSKRLEHTQHNGSVLIIILNYALEAQHVDKIIAYNLSSALAIHVKSIRRRGVFHYKKADYSPQLLSFECYFRHYYIWRQSKVIQLLELRIFLKSFSIHA